MTARDALDKLGHTLATSRETFPDRWPLDHVDIAAGAPHRTETITVPGSEKPITVCDHWPECQCDGDCAEPPPLPRWIYAVWLALFALCFVAAWAASGWSGQ